MLASLALAESVEFFVSVRCVNRMELSTDSDNTNFMKLDSALRHAGEI
jgi:hypothetical protein